MDNQNQILQKMKNKILTLTFAIAAIGFINAQKIDTEKVFGGHKYTQNGALISIGDLVSIMENNTEALALLKKGRTNRSFAGVLGFAGGALVGWPLGTSLGGGDANWTLAGIGAGLIAVGIPISSSANKKINQAVEMYNASLNRNAYNHFKPELKIVANKNGLGLSMNF
jgi:hypothetical protein